MQGFNLPDFCPLMVFAGIGFLASAIAAAFLVFHLAMAVWFYLT